MYLKTQIQKLIFIIAACALAASCIHKKEPSQEASGADSTEVITSDVAAISRQIEQEPGNAELYYQRSNIYFNDKYLGKALIDIDQAVKLDFKSPVYLFAKARILYAMNRTKDAAAMYESAIVLKPDYEEAKMKLAELYYIVKEHKKSIDLLNSVLASHKRPDAYFFKGMNLKETKDTARAISAFQLALEADPSFYDAAMQLGLIFTGKKDPVAAEYFSSALKISPRSEEAYFGRAYYFQQARQYQKALFDYRKVIEINPSNDDAYYNVGYINFEIGKWKEALRSWDICIQMNNNNLEAYYMRGLVREQQKEYEDAKLNYEYALQLDPQFRLAKEGMERLEKKR